VRTLCCVERVRGLCAVCLEGVGGCRALLSESVRLGLLNGWLLSRLVVEQLGRCPTCGDSTKHRMLRVIAAGCCALATPVLAQRAPIGVTSARALLAACTRRLNADWSTLVEETCRDMELEAFPDDAPVVWPRGKCDELDATPTERQLPGWLESPADAAWRYELFENITLAALLGSPAQAPNGSEWEIPAATAAATAARWKAAVPPQMLTDFGEDGGLVARATASSAVHVYAGIGALTVGVVRRSAFILGL